MSTLWDTPASSSPLFLSDVKVPEDLQEKAKLLAHELDAALEKELNAYRISRHYLDLNQILP